MSLAEAAKKRITKNAILFFLLGVGFLLSVSSLSDLCSGGCTAVSDYALFGVKFAYFGMLYFTLLSAILLFDSKGNNPWARKLFDLVVYAGVGAEVYFVLIQKFSVHQWCPICLSVGAVVLLVFGVRLSSSLAKHGGENSDTNDVCQSAEKRSAKQIVGMALIGFLAVLVGFASSVAGVKKAPVALSVEAKRLLSGVAPDVLVNPLPYADIWLGKKDSAVDVYIVSDWYCGYCKKIEPEISGILPDIAGKARYTWLDMPVHMASLNIVPVGISLLLNTPENTLSGRAILNKLTTSNPALSDTAAIAALKKAGIPFKPARENDVRRLVAETVNFCKVNNISMTPSVVVTSRATGLTKVMRGADEVSKAAIMMAIDSVQQIAKR